MSDAVDLDLRKQPQQERSRQTCAYVLDAAAKIIQSKGLAGLNTNLVAERAGVSVGSLYQYFPGKNAILVALIREMRREMFDDISAAVEAGQGLNLASAVRLLIDASLRHHLRNPPLTEALERAESELPLDAESQTLKAEKGALIVGVLQRHGVKDPQQTARDIFSICQGLVHGAVENGETNFEDLSARMNRAVIGYLSA